ncbi:hypothetical protein [Sphingobacterium mizutaii]|uniref:hypothetical protein n=1 Tax=Sphingobacterium mizutaii TaxID=1010 RepID=UPI00162AD325|nr:hypothetical protein [Sphingobacterium mizutaii]
MTKLIKKESDTINLYFTLDRPIEGDVNLVVVSDYTNNELYIDLGNPTISNSRYTLFILENPFKEYADGLYSYYLNDDLGQLETGGIKIQSNDFGQPSEFLEIDEDGDDFIVIED